MKRTVEIVLGIIGSFFNVIAIAFIGIMVKGVSEINNNTQFQDELVEEFKMKLSNDPQFQEIDIQQFAESMVSVINYLGPFGWFIIVCFIISLIVGIVAMVLAVQAKDKKATFAGIMFLVAGVFAGIISLTSIVYYSAAIICFVRKPKVEVNDSTTQDTSVI